MYQVSVSWYNCEPSISISITIQFLSIIPNTVYNWYCSKGLRIIGSLCILWMRWFLGASINTWYCDACRLSATVNVTCNRHFYGAQCDRYCAPRDNCTGHYTCNQSTGAVQCLPGWTGASCTVAAANTDFCPTSLPYQPPLTSELLSTV